MYEQYASVLKSQCGFIDVAIIPRGDAYGADTTVILTDSQVSLIHSIPPHLLRGKLIASRNYATFEHGPSFLKDPELTLHGNELTISGSLFAAQAFLLNYFQIQRNTAQ